MFRQVLVPVKFSVCGRLAAWHACDVVRAIGGTVTLLHVLEYSAPGHAERETGEAQDAEAQHQEALALLRQLGLYARRPPRLLIVPALNSSARYGSELHGSELHGSELHGSELHGSELHSSELHGSELHGSELHSLELHGSAPGGVASAILEVAAETGAELIMLGLRSQGGPLQGIPSQGILGRVVGPVLLGAGVPVQVTPCRPDTGAAPGAQGAGWRGVLAGQD